MTDAAISLSFPARQGYAIFLRTAVSGAAAAYDLPLDALEAFSALTESAEEGAQALCDIYRAQADQVTLSLRLGGRAGVPGPEDNADITRAVLLPLVNQAQVFYDARGCTGVRMTLRVG